MAEVASAFVSLVPSARGFGRQIDQQVGGEVDGSGRRLGKRFGALLAAGGAALGVGAIIKSSVDLEAAFSQTMNQIAAVTDTPAKKLSALSDLAIKMGADTVFSANDAANAMLELAKGGLSAAEIKAGALKGTLTLAAAGGLDLANAATYASNAMNTFGLHAKDVPKIAAALAGGANASTASVESLGEALSQVGPGAKNAGLSLFDTVGVLAAFDQAGIKGTDAGTSLKTMLSRLVPQTDKAAGAMRKYHLVFANAGGSFKSITDIAQSLRDGLGKLSETQKTQALTTIFGSDATRAASVLIDNGAKSIGKYIKATRDQGAAQRIADARMKGTAGALEQIKGSLETARLQLGRLVAPAVVLGLNLLTTLLNKLTPRIEQFGTFIKVKVAPELQKLGPPLEQFAGFVANKVIPAVQAFVGHLREGAGQGSGFRDMISGLVTWFRDRLVPAIKAVADKVLPNLRELFKSVTKTMRDHKSVIEFIGTAFKVLGIFLTDIFLPLLGEVASTILKVLGPAFRVVVSVIDRVVIPAIKLILTVFLRVAGDILTGAAKAFGWIPGLGPKLKAAAKNFAQFKDDVNAALGGIKDKTVKVHLAPKSIRAPRPSVLDTLGVPEGAGASGAIIRRPTVAYVGERGPEALIPLSETRGNSPIPQIGGHTGPLVNIEHMAPHDYTEFMRQVQTRTRMASADGIQRR